MAPKAGEPHKGKYVAYYRVSTDKQGRSGLGLAAQKAAVKQYLNGGNWDIIGEFTEIESGRKGRRPQLDAALAMVKKNKATLVVAKLDRLYRNPYFVAKLMYEKVPFVCCDNPHIDKFSIHILAAVNEKEAELISERTKAALKAAKARGQILGSPDPSKGARQAGLVVSKEADQFADNVLPLIRQLRKKGLTTFRELADALNARGVQTARGGQWHASTVRNYELRARD